MEVGHEGGELVVDVLNDLGQSAPQLSGGLIHRPLGLGVDEVCHRLGAGQIHFSRQEGPPGELARLGLAHPTGKQGL